MAEQRILIVDDQKEATRLMRSNLESLEHDFIIADVLSGEEALLEMAHSEIDLLIADVRLPGISGIELMEKFKQRLPEVKVILVSGVTDPKIRKQVAQAGAEAFYFKPIDIPDFLDGVERALNLVDTILQPELHIDKEEAEQQEKEASGMTSRITELRATLDASAVLLLGEQGQVLVRAGDLPDPELESAMMPTLMTSFTAGVGISRFLGQHTPDHLYSFRGENYDLFIAPVGEAYCLAVTTKPILVQELGKIAKDVQSTAKAVLLSLAKLGVSTKSRSSLAADPTAPETAEDILPEKPGVSDEELENLLSKAAEVKKEDADNFWDSASPENVPQDPASGDSLTYDEAVQLGLAPSED
ncbi:MAG: response regulator [Chloroflexota bacterium]